MAFADFTNLDDRERLEYDTFSAINYAQPSGRFGEFIRAAGTGWTEETFLRFDVSSLLFATIDNVELEITCNSQGAQSISQTGMVHQQDKNDIRAIGTNWYDTGFNFDTPFAVALWATTLTSFAPMRDTGVYTFLNTPGFKAHVQDWVDKRPASNWGLIIAINFGAVGHFLSLDSARLKINYTPASPARTIWGCRSAGHKQFNLSGVRMMGGTSPNPTGILKLKELSIYVGQVHTTQCRVAIYQGGALDNPVGASLVDDLGVTAGSTINTWISFGGRDITLAKNTPTWLAFKNNDGGFQVNYDVLSTKSGDMQSARGRWAPTAMSENENVAYEASIPAGGAFSSTWYPIVMHYIEEVGGAVPILRRRRELIQPF